jgi:hypothetical protein
MAANPYDSLNSIIRPAPPHFWLLATRLKDDSTRIDIFNRAFYSVIICFSFLPPCGKDMSRIRYSSVPYPGFNHAPVQPLPPPPPPFHCGKGYRNESTKVSISKFIIGTKPKRFDLVHLFSERKHNFLICSKTI